ncbi:response regulator [Sulfurimonas aquatica]|uniref:Response regulator n=1 Tax=Sulfurimonas aquatica TaxID=2672570 RepID=A0A975GCS3_9BACT|nr:response regulator [Sulfurimonas aquatica]QSZ42006.1 response regulator [Sulfurimonas aquatica]
MDDLKKLKQQAQGFKLLYVEDNDSLRENASKLLRKLFDGVEVAEDGAVAFELFKKHHFDIVITDIKMPNMNGISLAQHIKKIKPNTLIIIMSAFDDKEYLLDSIEVGIFRFIKKPVKISELSDVLEEALHHLRQEINSKLFTKHLENIFNYQSSMVMMINDTKPIIANDMFLDFFDCETINEFKKKHDNFGSEFLPHDGFLYNHDEIEWLDKLKTNERKLFHIKIRNLENKLRHFILKYQSVPEKNGYGVLSFEDVTELNLLKLFDQKQTSSDDLKLNTEAMIDLLEVIQRNSAKISMHNYYKGLSITNSAIISEMSNEEITIKTTYLQQKAIQNEQRTLIVSEALPSAIQCTDIGDISFENQSVVLKSLSFAHTSPIQRKTIRVGIEGKQNVSLFLAEGKFHGDIEIEDISLDAVKLRLKALPAGLEKGSVVRLDIVLELDKHPLIINTEATLLRKSESRLNYSVVFIFKETKKSELVKYITKRQMAIIREFKGLQNG